MPIYDHRCTKCDHLFEELLALDAAAPPCPKCGATAERVLSSAKFVAQSKMGPKAQKLDRELAKLKPTRDSGGRRGGK
jgi:putative FmdB family regulatory protein